MRTRAHLDLTYLLPDFSYSRCRISDANPNAADSDLALFAAHIANLSNNTLTAIEKVIVKELSFKDGPVENYENYILLRGTPLNDTITNHGVGVTLMAMQGDDILANDGSDTQIFAGKGADTITSSADNVTIIAEGGDELIDATGDNLYIND